MIRRVLIWLGRRKVVIALAARLQTPVDKWLWRLSRGRVSLTPTMPTLVLHTRGRRTGEHRTSPVFYVAVDGGYAITDTNYGRPATPGWSANLNADPSCHIDHGDGPRDSSARLATDSERDAAWAALCDLWPPYDDYAKRLDRMPRVWVIQPR